MSGDRGPASRVTSADEPALDPAAAYEVLRELASPLVAITVRRGDRLNGMVANSAVRASLVPDRLGVAFYVFKRHFTHRLLAETGRFALHLLSREQWDEIWALGFRTGWEGEKLEGLPYRLSERTELPILTRCYAWLECRVVNVMDAGPSTFFMGLVDRLERGSGGEVMDSRWFRANMPDPWREVYEHKLDEAQLLAARAAEIDDAPWRALNARARSAGAGD